MSQQQEVDAGQFEDVTTVIQSGSFSVNALTGSTEKSSSKEPFWRAEGEGGVKSVLSV